VYAGVRAFIALKAHVNMENTFVVTSWYVFLGHPSPTVRYGAFACHLLAMLIRIRGRDAVFLSAVEPPCDTPAELFGADIAFDPAFIVSSKRHITVTA
jgi:hypothetical protein